MIKLAPQQKEKVAEYLFKAQKDIYQCYMGDFSKVEGEDKEYLLTQADEIFDIINNN